MPASEAPRYQYDPNFGDVRAAYTPVDFRGSPGHRPELAGCFVAYVEGETIISTIHGHQNVRWRAEPGTPCMILGHWADDSVHVKWPAIANNYMIDARFPIWVVAEDPNAKMAGGGRVLPAHTPPPPARGLPTPVLVAIVAGILIVIAVIAALTLAR
jgi:hypothetical protein